GVGVAGYVVALPPHPRVTDEDYALLGVVVLRALCGPHPAVAGDDTDVAGGHHPLHPVRLGVRVHLHLVRILDGVVLARDHIAFEDGQPLPLETVEAIRVHDDGSILVVVLGLLTGGRGLGPPSTRPRRRRRAASRPPPTGPAPTAAGSRARAR